MIPAELAALAHERRASLAMLMPVPTLLAAVPAEFPFLTHERRSSVAMLVPVVDDLPVFEFAPLLPPAALESLELVVQFAVGVGVGVSSAVIVDVVEIETGAGAEIGVGRIETTYGGIGAFVIADDVLGLIETGGTIPDELVPEADWVEVACTELGPVTIDGPRRSSPLASFEAGEMSVTLIDPARRWDPVRAVATEPGLRGDFAAGGRTQLREGVRVRCFGRAPGVTIPLFTGFVDEWPTTLNSHRDAERVVRCHDWFGVLAKTADRNASPVVGYGETVSERIHRLLDIAGVPADERDIGSSDTRIDSTNLARNLLTELKLTAACDGGDLWVSPAGVVTFRSLVDQMRESRRWSPQMVVTNDPYALGGGSGVSVDVVPTKPPVIITSRERKSRFEIARVGGTAQVVSDFDLIAEFGLSVFARSDLPLLSDEQAGALAQQLLDLQSREPIALAEVHLDLRVDRQARSHGLQRMIGDRIATRHRDPDSATIALAGFVAGIRHEIDRRRWSCVMRTEDAQDVMPFTIETSAIESNHFISF